MRIITFEDLNKDVDLNVLNKAMAYFKATILKRHLYECSDDCFYGEFHCVLDFDEYGRERGLVIKESKKEFANAK